jgi:hypothetical protein
MAGATMVRETVDQWEKRLSELRPQVDEFNELQAALEAVRGKVDIDTPTRATGSRRGRPKGTGTRSKEFLALVKANPGITVADAAKRMQINPNYLYRVAGDLSKTGTVEKKGQGYEVVAGKGDSTEGEGGSGDK